MKVFGYVRRSSNESKVSNYSINSQKRICMEKAKANGEEIQEWYVDEGYSGSTLKRPDIQKILRQLPKFENEPVHIYIWMSSRLSREPMHVRSLRHVFEKYNVEVISAENDWVSLSEVEISPDTALKSELVGMIDKNELIRVKKRTKVGLKTSAQAGNYVKGGPYPPTGWLFVQNENGKGRRAELDPNYVETVIYICKQIHDNKRSIESIALELDAKKASNTNWNYTKVYNVVTNPFLYGRLIVSDYIDIYNHSPAYITKEYFDEMQLIIHGRRKEIKHSYLFKNMVKCDKCNTLCSEIPTIHYERGTETKPKHKRKKYRKVYLYYYCPSCKQRINEIKLTPQLMLELKEMTNKNDEKIMIDELNKKISRLDKRIEFLNEEYDEGIVDDEYYKKEIKQIRKKRNDIIKSISKITKKKMKKFNEYDRREQKKILRNNFNYIHVDLKTKKVVEVERVE